MVNSPSDSGDAAGTPRQIDVNAPHSARVWNYLLGGKDHYPADRQIGDVILQAFPDIAQLARLQRAFLMRAVRLLAGELGIRQFLDIGTGLPTANNTHEVAQAITPQARIVYVDNDPLVLVHAEALLVGTAEGVTDYIEADVRDPDTILSAAARTLDFSQPVALMMLGILGQLPDSDDPHSLLRHYLDALPAGSCLALSDGTDTNDQLNEAIRNYNANSASSYHLRSPERIADFFTGLDLIDPGVVPTSRWHPDATAPGTPPSIGDVSDVDATCGIGRKAT